jgi:hypothetical protein
VRSYNNYHLIQLLIFKHPVSTSVHLPSLIVPITTSLIPAAAISALIARAQETGRPQGHKKTTLKSIVSLTLESDNSHFSTDRPLTNIWQSDGFAKITLFFLNFDFLRTYAILIFYERMKFCATDKECQNSAIYTGVLERRSYACTLSGFFPIILGFVS